MPAGYLLAACITFCGNSKCREKMVSPYFLQVEYFMGIGHERVRSLEIIRDLVSLDHWCIWKPSRQF